MVDSPKGIDQISSPGKQNTLSRRSLIGAAAGAVALVAVDNLGLGSFPDGEGSISQRRGVFTKIVSEIAKAKVTGDKEAIETSEKILYLWTFCNVLEMGARFHFKYDLAANNMRHFLYGKGRPVDLSDRLGMYLKENYGVTNNKSNHEVGICDLISKATDSQIGIQGFDQIGLSNPNYPGKLILSDPNYPGRLKDFVYMQGVESQKSPIVLGTSLRLSDDNHQFDWVFGVGGSMYKLKYVIDKDWSRIDYPEGSKDGQLRLRVKSYDVSFTDIYDWTDPGTGKDGIMSPAIYFDRFMKSLGVDPGLLNDKIRRKYYSTGLPEKEFDLLVKNGYAHNFDMSGHASDSNLNLELSFPVAEA